MDPQGRERRAGKMASGIASLPAISLSLLLAVHAFCSLPNIHRPQVPCMQACLHPRLDVVVYYN